MVMWFLWEQKSKMHSQDHFCLLGQGQWACVINAYCMLPSFMQLALYNPCGSRMGTEEIGTVLREGPSVAFLSRCSYKCSNPLHYLSVSLIFLPPSFSALYFGGVSQACLQTLLYLFPPLIYSWLGPTSTIPEANVFAAQTQLLWYTSSCFFTGHYLKGRRKKKLIYKTWLGWGQESGGDGLCKHLISYKCENILNQLYSGVLSTWLKTPQILGNSLVNVTGVLNAN